MKNIKLYGALVEACGGVEEFQLEVKNAKEAIRALGLQIPAFRKALAEGDWVLFYDGQPIMDEEDVELGMGKAETLHIHPALEGAKSGGVGKVLAGAALIGASFFVPGSAAVFGASLSNMVGGIGVSMALTGVSAMLSPIPKTQGYESREAPDQRPSFLFDGPVNTSTQGLPVPIIYGRVKVGSVVISGGMFAEEIT